MDRFSWGLEVWMRHVLASSLFINRLDSWEKIRTSYKFFCFQTLALVGYNVFFLLRSVEKRKREDEGGCYASKAQESTCWEISFFVMSSVDHFKKINSQIAFQPVRTMYNLSILPKDRSQTGWRPIHLWWTRRWFGLHWSTEADSEPSIVFWRKPKKLTPSFATSSILASQQNP